MPKGDPCKGKIKGAHCPSKQPCPLHKYNGKDRKRPAEDVSNVVSMFTEETQQRKGERKTRAHDINRKGDRQGKVRLSRRWTKLLADVRAGEYTWADVVNDMDAEELARCRFKDQNGGFQGRPPVLVPAEFVRACHNEIMERFNVAFRENLQIATNELIRLATESDMEDKDRAKLLVYMIERVTGKVPEKLEVRAADPWEQIIEDIVSEVPDDVANTARYMKEPHE